MVLVRLIQKWIGPQEADASLFPPKQEVWAMYFSIYGHTIGVSWEKYYYFIMGPNTRLFESSNKCKLLQDLQQLIRARSGKAKPDTGKGVKVFTYRT